MLSDPPVRNPYNGLSARAGPGARGEIQSEGGPSINGNITKECTLMKININTHDNLTILWKHLICIKTKFV